MANIHLLVQRDHNWGTHCGALPTLDDTLIPLSLFLQYKDSLCPGCQQWPQPAFMAQRQAGELPFTACSTSEKVFMARIISEAKKLDWLVYHTHDARRSEPGFPDLVLVKAGQPVWLVECKTETGRLTQAQTTWLDTLHASAQTIAVDVWRPTDWDTIREILGG
jgi:choline dehydrogenase-like flavoprotein